MEEAGIPTVAMTVGLDITQQVLPPRSVFLDYPMGNETGRPNLLDEQRFIVRAALEAATKMKTPGSIVDLGLALEEEAPDGRPWQEWVYTKPFRRHHMKTREGEKPQ